MMLDRTITLPSLKPYQTAIFHSPAQIAVCEASTKAGKTVGVLHWLLQGALEDTGPTSSLYLTYVYKQAEKMFERLSRWLMKSDPGMTWWGLNKTKLVITIKHGLYDCLICFMGSENYDAVYGSDYVRVAVDEASRMRVEAWYAARSTITATRGKARIIGNVKGSKNWAFQLARKAQAGTPGMSYHKITAADAVREGVFSKEDLDAARRDYPEAVFRELYYAEATEDGSNPFGIQHIRACVRDGLAPGPAVAYGVDLARKIDWTVVVGLNASGGVCVLERWQHESWRRSCEMVADIIGDAPTFVDGTGVGDAIIERINETRPNAESFLFTPKSKQQIMEGLAVAIQHRAVGIPDGIMVQELESFEYEHTDRSVRYSAPEGMTDDTVCAFALAVKRAEGGRVSERVYVGELGDMSEGEELEIEAW